MSTDGLDTDGTTPLSPQKRVLLTNQQNPVFEYTYLATDPNLWDESFTMTLVLALAARLAIALTSDKSLAQLKIQEANALIMEARRQDGNEGLTILDSIPDWLRSPWSRRQLQPVQLLLPLRLIVCRRALDG
jgi:hypothetical protein